MTAANTPLLPDTYVPIVKGKRAEFGAVESCSPNALVPLIEILNPASAMDDIVRAWPHQDHVSWIHSLNLNGDDESAFAGDIENLFAGLRATRCALPVITANEEATTLEAIQRVVAADGRGVVIRIEAEDLLDVTSSTISDLDSTLVALGLPRASADLVLDCGLLSGSAPVQAAVGEQCMRKLPNVTEWRSVVVAFAAFPAALADVVPVSSVTAISRDDAIAFSTLRAAVRERAISFGDYTVGVPTYSSVPFAPIPNIRYASDRSWHVHRGFQRRDPSTQYRSLARDVVAAAYYSGPAFSAGDQSISDVATGVSGPGNATTHLRAAISRHIHVVLDRLATLGEP